MRSAAHSARGAATRRTALAPDWLLQDNARVDPSVGKETPVSACRHRTAVGSVLVLLVWLVGCTSDEGSSAVTTGTTGAATEPAPSTGEVPSTEFAPGATTPATTPATSATAPVPDGVIVGAALTADLARAARSIAQGDEFVDLSAVEQMLVVGRSTDGIDWTSSPTDVSLDAVRFAASTDEELFVSSGTGSSAAQPLRASVSADGGLTWSTSPLSVPATGPGWLEQDVQLAGLAATESVALAIGTAMVRGDWQQYAIEVLGTDHGQVTGEGGEPSNWTVEFEDGFRLTVDLDELGLSDLATWFQPMLVAWVRTEAAWEQVSLPFAAASATPLQLVAGPAGFLATGVETDLIGGVQNPMLYSSADGITWRADELPEGFSTSDLPGGVFLVGGPLGYVLVGETRLAFSPDAATWSDVAEFDDLVPGVSGFLSAGPPAGGQAGFAIAFSDPSGSGVEPRVLVSLDGRTWEPVALSPAALDATLAVGHDSILVRPVIDATAPETGAPPDSSIIQTGGGAGGRRPAAMCDAPESVTLVAYALADGAYRWHLCGTGSTWYDLVAASSDTVYVSDIGSSSSDVLAIDASTGAVTATLSRAEVFAEVPDDAATPMHAAPHLEDVRLSGGQDDPLVAVDAATGAALWSANDPLAYDDVWAVGDGAVYMGHVEPNGDELPTPSLRAYELRTGAVRWEVPMTTGAYYPWWFGDGLVFALWTDVTVVASDTGEVLWATDYATDTFPGMRGVLANDDTAFVTFTSQWGGGD